MTQKSQTRFMLTVFIFICSLFQIGESAHISLTEQRQYGMRAETEVRMPVLHVTF